MSWVLSQYTVCTTGQGLRSGLKWEHETEGKARQHVRDDQKQQTHRSVRKGKCQKSGNHQITEGEKKGMCWGRQQEGDTRDCSLGSLDFRFEPNFMFSSGQQRTGLGFSPKGGGGEATGMVSALKSTELNPGPGPNPTTL